jgi:hypothetical protein
MGHPAVPGDDRCCTRGADRGVAHHNSRVGGRGTTPALKSQNGIEFANQVFAGVRKIAEASELADNPLKAITFETARELFDDTLAERWNARFY